MVSGKVFGFGVHDGEVDCMVSEEKEDAWRLLILLPPRVELPLPCGGLRVAGCGLQLEQAERCVLTISVNVSEVRPVVRPAHRLFLRAEVRLRSVCRNPGGSVSHHASSGSPAAMHRRWSG